MNENEILKSLAENQARQTALMEQFMNKDGMATKAPAATQTATPLHGPGGIWTHPGLERDILTAHVRPMGIAGQLPWLPTTYTDPRFGTLTGYTQPTGNQPDNSCEAAPSGYVKGCNLTARFGMIRYDTNTIEMDKVMLKINRGDHMDLRLKGAVLGLTDLEPAGLSQEQILNVYTMSEMVTVGVNFERELTRQTWQGVVTATNEFPGLDVQIATGQVDADTNTACPALDSDVKDFAYDLLGGSGRDIVEYLTMLMYYLEHNAQRMGLSPTQFAVVMRPQMWQELSAIWPCAYNTNKCASSVIGTSTVYIDGRENVDDRRDMRQRMVIEINDKEYPVIVDDGIFEHNSTNNANLNPGEFASSIYVVPLTVVGGLPVTYMQYLDYREAAIELPFLQNKEDFWWTDGGRYSWALDQNLWCYLIAGKIEPRIVLQAPHLAGRVDHVRISPLQHIRDPFPTSSYFADGGVSLRDTAATYYAVWETR
jgi:hypothetical protein